MSKEELEEYENKIVMQKKSKLQKEAENYLNQNCERWESDSLCVDDIAIENYLAGAEPREKHIAELERNVAYYAERAKHAELTGRDYVLKSKDFEKENAELKADNDARKFAMAMSEKVEKQLREENAKLKNQLEMSNKVYNDNLDYSHHIEEQLTKAKELVRSLYYIIKDRIDYENNIGIKDEMWRAEQFLKDSEVEK